MSPEELFCSLAKRVTKEALLLLGLELCGTYSIDKRLDSCEFNVEPLTNPKKIEDHILHVKKFKKNPGCINKALYVAGYLEGMAASPAEALLYAKLCLPRGMGGFGVKNLCFNKRIVLSKSAAKIAGQRDIYIDLSNPASKVAIEYDSEQFHDNSQQNIRDKRRLDALYSDGWKIFSIVKPQLNERSVFNEIAELILKANGQSARISVKHFLQKQIDLDFELQQCN